MVKSLGSLLRNLEVVELRGDPDTVIKGISYDSRKVCEGDLFVAVRGTRQDGTQYIEEAVRRGASAVAFQGDSGEGIPVAWIRFENSRRALASLASSFYDHPSRDIQLIGVTGTNGKTTTTLLLESILKEAGCSTAVLGTLGYRWSGSRLTASMTTPESLDLQRLFHEMRRDGVTHAVMEVSSHALALGRVEGCMYRAGLFTNLSQDHLDFHETMDAYFEAKSLLFRNHFFRNGKSSAAVINVDDPFGRRLVDLAAGEVWGYSVAGREARLRVKQADLTPSGIRAEIETPSGTMRVESPLLGRLNLYNILGALATAWALEVPWEAAVEGLRKISSVDGRLQRVPIPEGCGFEVVVDYAHTPDAMEKALGCLREMTPGRLLVVFGCGGDRDRGKRPLMGEVAGRLGDLVVLTSDNPRSEDPGAILGDIEPGVRSSLLPPLQPVMGEGGAGKGYAVVPDRKKAIELALLWARPGDIVFVGGKGHETYQIMGGEVFPFDDRQVVRSFLASAELKVVDTGSVRKGSHP